MNTMESCMTECPIVQDVAHETKIVLFEQHWKICLQRRLGQLGTLCGIPQGPDKDEFSRNTRQIQRNLATVAV